ncbi:MAG: VWA domain-containing protein [Desulfobulbaceae bacterium]|uniref:VWA domain-containing protein n=1 Tax=Candidatus Desulfobia pelagia TaxID=2841692 RepID=A0A8J6NEZ7_9BACT|nr:VWA domain-containing protein [Candidatus Desulfobia pelagia]
MRFAFPWAFLALILIIPFVSLQLRRNRRSTVRYSSIALFAHTGTSLRQRLHYLPLALRVLALILLTVGLARPQQGLEKIQDVSHGIAIEAVVDRSSSMGETMNFDGTETNRLEVVKKIFSEFISGNNDDLTGRPNDLIGVVSFARFAETACPLTLAHEAVDDLVQNISLVDRRDEDGTSIGDGLGLAVARLEKVEEALARMQQENPSDRHYQIKSKIIILLTDGAHNRGTLTPSDAAELAKSRGIKIYTVGIGSENGPGGLGGFFSRIQRAGRGVDQKTLAMLAEETGGVFRMASNADSLRAIYGEIDQLEKSEIESIRFIDYREFFVPFIQAALALLLLEFLLSSTLFRKVP